MTKPLISVISIIYRVEPYLRQCLESLEKLTYPNLELILVVGQSGKGPDTDDNCLHHVTFFDLAAWDCRFYGSNDNVTDIAASSERTAQDSDTHNFLSAAVVCDFKPT